MNEADYYLKPGFLFASGEPSAVSTVLGSCVSVCLFDRRLGIGGINHYIHPRFRSPKERNTSFGDVATSTLANVLMEWGSRPGDLEAVIIGGASLENSSASEWVARENVSIARSILADRGIALVREETGGYRGRKLVFHTATGRLDWTFLSKGEPV